MNILCSQASASKVQKYYHELDSDQLPGKLNFFTSAYFTGFDLKESYHLISVSSTLKGMYALSDRRLKQIAGRCRTGLLSETIIHDAAPLEKKELKNLADLLEAATIQAESIACMKKHYMKSRFLSLLIEDFNERIVSFLDEKGSRYIHTDNKNQIVVPHLNIDATLEAQRIRVELYESSKKLTQTLAKSGHTVL